MLVLLMPTAVAAFGNVVATKGFEQEEENEREKHEVF